MRTALILALAFLPAAAQDEPKPEPVDVGAVLAKSKEFLAKCKEFKVEFDREKGTVRALGEIAYRGGGPCEYLVNVFPAKSHETIVLLDNGPWAGKGRRPRGVMNGLATTVNNALLAAGFKKGKAFDWDRETGDVFPPTGETVHMYAEFKDEKGGLVRARLADWLWNFITVDAMKPGHFVYTGSVMIDEGPPKHKKWFGAEIDRLLVGILNTQTVLIDNTEEGSLDNGTYEAIPVRIPDLGTRVTVVFSRKPLEHKVYEPLVLNKAIHEARKRRAEKLAAKAKEDAEKKKEKKKEKDGE